MSDSTADRQIAELRLEIRWLRNLLRLQDGAEQATLGVLDPGLVTMKSPEQTKVALFGRLFACRRDFTMVLSEDSHRVVPHYLGHLLGTAGVFGRA
jgi:hypothetical protein